MDNKKKKVRFSDRMSANDKKIARTLTPYYRVKSILKKTQKHKYSAGSKNTRKKHHSIV
jgi:hypothetical protein